jgi:Mg/Co/Ni transporter MgtE
MSSDSRWVETYRRLTSSKCPVAANLHPSIHSDGSVNVKKAASILALEDPKHIALLLPKLTAKEAAGILTNLGVQKAANVLGWVNANIADYVLQKIDSKRAVKILLAMHDTGRNLEIQTA